MVRIQGTALGLSLSLALMISSCASYTNKPYQTVRIDTSPVEQVQCVLETPVNKYRLIAPGEIIVERSHENLDITCEKALYHPTHLTVSSDAKWEETVTPWNALFLGAAYDAMTKAVYHYPDVIRVDMQFNEQAMYDRLETQSGEPNDQANMDFVSPDTTRDEMSNTYSSVYVDPVSRRH